jgi:hypothetical protein
MAVGPTNVKSPANEIPIKKEQILPPSTAGNQTGKTKRQRIIEMPEQISHKQSHDETVHEDPDYEANLEAARRGKASVEQPSSDEDSCDAYENSEAYRQSLIRRYDDLVAQEQVYLEEADGDVPDFSFVPERLPSIWGEAADKLLDSQNKVNGWVGFTHPTMQEFAYNLSGCAELSRYDVSYVSPQHM